MSQKYVEVNMYIYANSSPCPKQVRINLSLCNAKP